MIDEQQVSDIAAFVEQQGLNDTTLGALRQQYPGCHFTYCMDDDVHFPKAFLERPQFNIYLVNSTEHCSTLTSNTQIASGIVLAEVLE